MPGAASRAWCDDSVSSKAVAALFKTYCTRCHNAENHEADVDLTTWGARPKTLDQRKAWQKLLYQLQSEEMPPEEPLPSGAERDQLVAWVKQALEVDWSMVRDPGRVTIPRLTRDEYNHTLRDLLGIDLEPGQSFSPDGEGKSGFNTDRDALFLTPAQLEKYLQAADSALDAIFALVRPRTQQHFESEAMFMTETRERPRDFGDGFTGYVLNRGQMTLYDAANFPYDGFYTFTVRVRAVGGPSGGRLRLDGEEQADLFTTSGEAETFSVTCFVKRGSRQMTWNIQRPSAAQLRASLAAQAAVVPAAEINIPDSFNPVPEDAGEIVSREAPRRAARYRATGDESQQVAAALDRVNQASINVQRPYEWLRLLTAQGEPSQVVRFKSYVADRQPQLEKALAALAGVLGESLETVQSRFARSASDELADRQRLLAAVEHVDAAYVQLARTAQAGNKRGVKAQVQPTAAGNFAIDWIKIEGPVRPEGADETRLAALLSPPGETPGDQARAALSAFIPRAFRRPLEPGELDRYLDLFEAATARGEDFHQAMKLPLTAVLVSPHFLYRNELGPVDVQYALDDYQLASRLSYFLWMSMPDDELFELAAAGKLRDAGVLETQVERMLADARARAFTSTFLGQWLEFEALGASVMPDAEKFPEFTPELAAAMKQETILAFESLFAEDGSLLELLDARQTWLNESLARHYGIKGVRGSEMRRVTLDDAHRGGLLGMASVLTATSSPTRTSPVLRGKWVLERLLGERIAEPPADAGTLDPDAGEARGKSLREELMLHRRNPTCAGCHDKIDPIGFGLENFDAIGRYRTDEVGESIDNSGELPGGGRFRGPAELKQVLLQSRQPQFARNVVERMLSFALGRGLELHDEPTIAAITDELIADNFRVRTLIKQVVMSYPFQYQNNLRPLD